MNMPRLPDVPEEDWRTFSADRWFQKTSDQINSIGQLPVQPGLGFLQSSSSLINSLQVPLPQPPQFPERPQPLPTPLPTPLPQPTPTPTPAPPISLPLPGPPQQAAPPAVAPSPFPSLPTPTRPPPVSTPEEVQGPTPLTPQTPLTPGAVPAGLPRSTYAPQTTPTPQQSPFADQTQGPFATPTPRTSPVNFDANAPAMQAVNAVPAGELQNYARQAAQKAGINPDLFAAQIQQESGFNPNAGSPAGAQGIAQIVPKYHPGVNTADPYASLDYAANLMRSHLDRYGGDWQKALVAYNGGSGAVQAWESGQPYQESQTYVSRILGTSRPNQTTSPTPAPVSTAMSTSQFGDRQLSSDEAYASCGPAAAVRFAQAYGRNPTLREAVDLARQVGWTAAQGMAGIGSEQRLLQSMGIPTHLVGADLQAIAREAETGNPVTISTPGHYFYADGYNPQSGAFHVGQSGLDLKQGAEWMTAQQMETLMGAIQGALFADNPQVPARSSTASVGEQLDQMRNTISSTLSGRPSVQQIPRQTMTTFGSSADPALQQLDDAVQSAAAPQRAPWLSSLDTARSGNLLDDLGNTIGRAIADAFANSGFGGMGPPGGPPRGGDQQSDQNQPQPVSPDQGDVGTRARQMIERIQTVPGGHRLSDIVGLPDLLPPDTRGMSRDEIIREMIGRAGGTAANMSRPSIGPGGLGMFDPRLGNDPRADVPDMLEPLGHLGDVIGRLIGHGDEEALKAAGGLDEAFSRNLSAHVGDLTGGPSAEALGSLVQSGERLASNRNGPPLSVVNDLGRTRAEQLWDWGVRQFFDQGTDINNVTRQLAQRLGRPLTDSERLDLLARVEPSNQAREAIDQILGPALQQVPTDAMDAAKRRIELLTDKSIAEGLGKKAERDFLEGGIAQNTTRRLDEANAELDRAQQAYAQSVADQRAVDLGVHRTKGSISLNAAGQRVRDAQAALEDAAQNASEAAAAHAHERTMRSQAGELIRNPEQRDLFIAESDLKRANARYDRLAARDASIPIAPTGQSNAVRRAYESQLATLARQVGYAEDRVSRLRTALGENVATREAAVGQRAAAAGEQAGRYLSPEAQDLLNKVRTEGVPERMTADLERIAREHGIPVTPDTTPQDVVDGLNQIRRSPPATPELAAARVRLRYEQQNLDRLQQAKAAGQQGLVDDLARAQKKVDLAQRDVDVATRELPEAAAAQGYAQRTGRDFTGPAGETIHYDDVLKEIQNMDAQYANRPDVQRGFSALEDATQKLRTNMLDEKVQHGIIGDDVRQGLLDTYDFHTPTTFTDYLTDQSGRGLRRGSKFNVGDAGFHAYTPEGTSLQHGDHLAALIREVYSHKTQIKNNDVVRGLIEGFGSDSKVMKKIADSVKEYVDAGGKDSNLLHPDYNLKANERKIVGMINGKKQEYVTDNALLKNAIDQVGGSGDPSTLQRVLMAPANLVKETAVHRNPLFLPAGIARDAASYALRHVAEGGIGANLTSGAFNLGPAALVAATTDPNDPNRTQKIAAALAAGFGGRAMIGRGLGLGPSATAHYFSALADAFEGFGTGRMTGKGAGELAASGAGMSGASLYGGPSVFEDIGRLLSGDKRPMAVARSEDMLRTLSRKNVFQVRNGADLRQLLSDVALGGWVKALGQRFEQVPRIATREMALERGTSPLQAMNKAREVTMDFNRGGRFTRELNRFVPFFNVGAQAPAQLKRLIQEHPGSALFAGTALLGGPAAAAEAWNYADPQRAQDYQDEPEYLKRLGVSLMLPGEAPRDAQGNRVPQKIFLPIPNEFMPFVEAGREAFHHTQEARRDVLGPLGLPFGDTAIANQGRGRTLPEVASAAGQELSPIGAANTVEAGIGNMIPAPAGTAMQLEQNRDWFRGSTIANQYSDENASNLSKALAPELEAILTSLPGNSDKRVRPSQIDFAIKDMLSGVGQQGLNVSDMLSGRQPRVPGAAAELPLVGSLAQRFVRGTGGQSWEDVRDPERMMAPDIRQRLRELGGSTQYYEPSVVPGDMQKIPLRREEQVAYQRFTNQYFDEQMRRYMNTRSFSGRDVVRKQMIDQAMTTARARAQAQVLKQIRASGSSVGRRVKEQSAAF